MAGAFRSAAKEVRGQAPGGPRRPCPVLYREGGLAMPDLLDRVHADPTLRRPLVAPVGDTERGDVFAGVCGGEFPARVHAAMIRSPMRDKVVERISRDSTAIEARERPERKPKPEKKPETKPKRGRGRPRRGEVVERPERRLERQDMSLDEMIGDLPKELGKQTEREGTPRVGPAAGRASTPPTARFLSWRSARQRGTAIR